MTLAKRPSYRQQKVGNVLAQAVARVVDEKRGFMRLPFITINHIKMSADLKLAKIYISLYDPALKASPSEAAERQAVTVLNNHAGLIRRDISDKVYLKSVPELRFHRDDSLRQSNHLVKLIDSIKQQ